MLRYLLSFLLILTLPAVYSQKQAHFSFAITNQASAYPFSKFFGFIHEPVHPGFEAGFSKVAKEKKHHEWFYDIKAGYFYHRFVQHGIPVYLNYGYRHKFSKHFSADLTIGAGYFHSIPATEVLKQDANGDYKNAKGIGRSQAMFAVTPGINYLIPLKKGGDIKLFFQYQQRMQAPFIKSYVPLLPYNQLALGVALPSQFLDGKNK